MKKVGILLSVLVMVIGLSVSAQAALVDMHDGRSMTLTHS